MKYFFIALMLFSIQACGQPQKCDTSLPAGLRYIEFKDGRFAISHVLKNPFDEPDILLTGQQIADWEEWTWGWIGLSATHWQLEYGKFKSKCDAKAALNKYLKFKMDNELKDKP